MDSFRGRDSSFFFFFIVIACIGFVLALVALVRMDAHEHDMEHGSVHVVELPPNTVQLSENVYCLGNITYGPMTFFLVNRLMEHHESGLTVLRRETVPSNQTALPTCCRHIIENARWKNAEPYILDTRNSRGLREDFIIATFHEATQAWQGATDFPLFGRQLLGASSGLLFNGRNEIAFGVIRLPDASRIIAVTGVTFDCEVRNPSTGACISAILVVEHDQIYNTNTFPWGDATQESNVIDLLNIAVHELGHSLGLNDLYEPLPCDASTMWGFSSLEETAKRTLDQDTQKCIMQLYGEKSTTPKSASPHLSYPRWVSLFLGSIYMLLHY